MTGLIIEGVPQKDLDASLEKVDELTRWAKSDNIDFWAFRAALLKALKGNAEEYFQSGAGTYREIAAFDNAVATAIDSIDEK